MGAANYTFTGQPLAVLSSPDAPFPTEASADFIGKGYEVDPGSGRPTFLATLLGTEVRSKITPDEQSRTLTHQVELKDRSNTGNLYFKLAEGSTISTVADGSFAIDDARYFIRMISGGKPVIRDINGRKELVLPVEGNSLSYTLVW